MVAASAIAKRKVITFFITSPPDRALVACGDNLPDFDADVGPACLDAAPAAALGGFTCLLIAAAKIELVRVILAAPARQDRQNVSLVHCLLLLLCCFCARITNKNESLFVIVD